MSSRPLSVLRPLLLTAILALLALPSAAPALELEVVNDSGKQAWITPYTASPANYDVTGHPSNTPIELAAAPGSTLSLDVQKLISGRVLVAYGPQGATEPLDFQSQTRFDWIELTLTPADGDVANLTALEQFAIGMRLDTFDGGEHVSELASANSNTIFDALQGIPGGPESTIRSGGEIVRVLSPIESGEYPDLGEYVRSMAGKTIHLHSTFNAPPNLHTYSSYSGTFAADGSITLSGSAEGPDAGTAPPTFTMPGAELIEDVYSGKGTPNNLEGQIRHDVLVGFMAGYWDGVYGNDAIDFCLPFNRMSSGPFSYCDVGFNQPAFGDARASLSPFPTCEQYAAVINEYADMYGNPYSDGASGRVTIPIVKEGSKEIDRLRLTLQPDEGGATPGTGGNSNCGAAAAGGAAPAPAATASAQVGVHAKLFGKARLRRGKLKVARVSCSAPCGRVRAVVRKGKRVLARALVKRAGRKRLVVAHLTKPGRKLLRRHRKLKSKLDLWVAPPGGPAVHRRGKLLIQR